MASYGGVSFLSGFFQGFGQGTMFKRQSAQRDRELSLYEKREQRLQDQFDASRQPPSGAEAEEGPQSFYDVLSGMYDANPALLDASSVSGRRAIAEAMIRLQPGEVVGDVQDARMTGIYSMVQSLGELKATGKTSFGDIPWELAEGETPEDSLYRAISQAASHELIYKDAMPALMSPEEKKEFRASAALASHWQDTDPKSAAVWIDQLRAVEDVLASRGAAQRDPNSLLRQTPAKAKSVVQTPGGNRVEVGQGTTFRALGEMTNSSDFKKWYSAIRKAQGFDVVGDPDDPRHKYDYRGLYGSGFRPSDIGPDKHLPSSFKADDHPNRYVGGVDTKASGPTTPQLTKSETFRPKRQPAPVIRQDRPPIGPEQYLPGESENTLLGAVRRSAIDLAGKLDAGDGLSEEEWAQLDQLQKSNLFPQYWQTALQNYSQAEQVRLNRTQLEEALRPELGTIPEMRAKLAEDNLKQAREKKRSLDDERTMRNRALRAKGRPGLGQGSYFKSWPQ